MKIAIRYFTRSGNTRKLANAIGEAVNVQAFPVTEKLKENVDILFLGSSVYAFGVDENVKKFIEETNVKVGIVINFSTAALVKSTYGQIKKLLKNKEIPLAKEEFHCKGSFGKLHKGRPNKNDLDNAQIFAKDIITKYLK